MEPCIVPGCSVILHEIGYPRLNGLLTLLIFARHMHNTISGFTTLFKMTNASVDLVWLHALSILISIIDFQRDMASFIYSGVVSALWNSSCRR